MGTGFMRRQAEEILWSLSHGPCGCIVPDRRKRGPCLSCQAREYFAVDADQMLGNMPTQKAVSPMAMTVVGKR